ncbi:hypothetical protein YA64_016800 [Acinetobacter pittii]|nr:hypothetical protein YA64_016800 [Acinetobacter pittii]
MLKQFKSLPTTAGITPNWFGKFQYRCYQYDKICDFSTLVQAYAGYLLKFQPSHFPPSSGYNNGLPKYC